MQYSIQNYAQFKCSWLANRSDSLWCELHIMLHTLIFNWWISKKSFNVHELCRQYLIDIPCFVYVPHL